MEQKIEVICTQCGATLIPDKENMIYRCTHCGVAYGSSIIFDKDAISKAKKALSYYEFNEADVWFRCVLMLCPDDFEALRGRILSSGKWRSFGEIREPLGITAVRLKNVRASINDALAHANEEDKVYFVSCNKMIDILELVWKQELKIRPLTEKKAKLEAELLITPKKEEDDMGYPALKSSIDDVDSQIASLVDEKTDLLTQFNEARQSVIDFERSKQMQKNRLKG